jgi:DNA-binding response OmpR family regulator
MDGIQPQAASPDKYRILIMDDDLNISQLLQDALEDKYETRYSTEPLRFMDEVRSFRPHLILLDIMMPYLDGRDQLRLMTHSGMQPLEDSTPGLHPAMPPVIVITADPTVASDDAELQGCGVRAVLHKPFNLDELYIAIQRTLSTIQDVEIHVDDVQEK